MKYPDKISIVEQLLSTSGITTPPITLSKIMKYWDNVQVTLDDIEGDAFLVDMGILGANILIKKKARKERQRFSLAHELGHLVLKEKGLPIIQSSLKSRDLEMERWCNEFASELLMPSAWIRHDVIGTKVNDLYALSHKLAVKYQVSYEALLIRLSEVTPVNVIRINISDHIAEIKYNKSKVEPINLDSYKNIIFDKINNNRSINIFNVDSGVYCYLQAQLIKRNVQNWISFLVKATESRTIEPGRSVCGTKPRNY